MALDVPAGRAVRVTLGGTRYLPIAEHGLIGDLHTVALVGTDGTIDWYCCPRFDSPSVFAAILDADHGGLFRISPDCDGWSSKQLYLPDTNILITRFLMPDGVGEVQDFMPPPAYRQGGATPPHDPPGARRARADALRRRRRSTLRLRARPPRGRAHPGRRALPLSRAGAQPLGALPLEIIDGGGVRARIAVRAGETATFVLDRAEPGEAPVTPDAGIAARVRRHRGVLAGLAAPLALQRALARDGASLGAHAQAAHVRAHRRYRGRPTTSLPEEVGGARNWDYRYTWMRDAAFMLYALLRLGFTEEAGAFMQWLERRFRHAADRESGPLQVMYGVDGREDLPEEELSHLEGYMGSAPVRIGSVSWGARSLGANGVNSAAGCSNSEGGNNLHQFVFLLGASDGEGLFGQPTP
jgi:hypothetical protein